MDADPPLPSLAVDTKFLRVLVNPIKAIPHNTHFVCVLPLGLCPKSLLPHGYKFSWLRGFRVSRSANSELSTSSTALKFNSQE